MGTDVARISETYNFLLIEALPAIVQLSVALYLLYSQLGAVCVAPIIITVRKYNINCVFISIFPNLHTNGIVIVATGLSTQLAGLIGPRQKSWIQAMQRRINYTSEILGSMKNVKMLGLTDNMVSNIDNLRTDELAVSIKYRIVQSLDISLGKSGF